MYMRIFAGKPYTLTTVFRRYNFWFFVIERTYMLFKYMLYSSYTRIIYVYSFVKKFAHSYLEPAIDSFTSTVTYAWLCMFDGEMDI